MIRVIRLSLAHFRLLGVSVGVSVPVFVELAREVLLSRLLGDHRLVERQFVQLAFAQPLRLGTRRVRRLGFRHVLLLHQPFLLLLLRLLETRVDLGDARLVFLFRSFLAKPDCLASRLGHRVCGGKSLFVVETSRLLNLLVPLLLLLGGFFARRLRHERLLRGVIAFLLRLDRFRALRQRRLLRRIDQLVPAKRGTRGKRGGRRRRLVLPRRRLVLPRRGFVLPDGTHSTLGVRVGVRPGRLFAASVVRVFCVVLDVVLRLLLALLEVDDALLLELVEVLRVLAVPIRVEEIFAPLDLRTRVQLRLRANRRVISEEFEVCAIRVVDLLLHVVGHERLVSLDVGHRKLRVHLLRHAVMVRVPLLAVLGLEVESVAGPGLELGLDGVESVLDLEHPVESVRVGVAKPTLLLDVLVDVLARSLGRDLGGDAVDERLEGTALVVIAAVPEQIGLVAAAVRVDLVEPRAVQPRARVSNDGEIPRRLVVGVPPALLSLLEGGILREGEVRVAAVILDVPLHLGEGVDAGVETRHVRREGGGGRLWDVAVREIMVRGEEDAVAGTPERSLAGGRLAGGEAEESVRHDARARRRGDAEHAAQARRGDERDPSTTTAAGGVTATRVRIRGAVEERRQLGRLAARRLHGGRFVRHSEDDRGRARGGRRGPRVRASWTGRPRSAPRHPWTHVPSHKKS